MKDRAFSGRDVQEAVAAAAAGLGLPAEALRYVILETGSPGGLGVGPSPARIAVLLDASSAGRRPDVAASPPAQDPRAEVRGLLRALAEEAGLDVAVEVSEQAGTLQVTLAGPDAEFFLGASGEGEVLRAFEHLLQRVFAGAGGEEPLRLECAGFRDRRDRALTEKAIALAAEVKGDGVARTTAPLNAYERRVIHVALSQVEGVVTYSVGEGADRRVTVALAPPPGSSDAS